MTQRRTRTLALLERLARQRLDAEARVLGQLRADLSATEAERARLIASVETDATPPDQIGAAYTGSWLNGVSTYAQALSAQAVHLRREASDAQDRLAELYREAKTFEQLKARETEARKSERAAKEQAQIRAHLERLLPE
ncbi:hypothetical protein [Litorisediminicola beolgyonensis]|uniref:Flagellar FliJ protein n=1 Tax=Litorisediminicola beolgyonensis TaxID=1173614 RepID=A0ABW3ZH54_9RHOB